MSYGPEGVAPVHDGGEQCQNTQRARCTLAAIAGNGEIEFLYHL